MEKNIFEILVEYRQRCGDDMENVARDLAMALKRVCVEGVGAEKADAEIQWLLSEVEKN